MPCEGNRHCSIALALATAAAAQDACLTGDATLGDQRAHRGAARVRPTPLSVCVVRRGAARAAGVPALRARRRSATRSTPARCGTSACRTARELYSGATCGTDRVACGGSHTDGRRGALPPGGAERAQSVRRQAGGRSRRACTRADALRRRDRLDGRAPASTRACSGPYGVGVRTVIVTPRTRSPARAHRARLDTVIWYPTTPGAGPVDDALRRRHRRARRPVRRPLSAAACSRTARADTRAAVHVPHAADRLVRVRRRGAAASGQYHLRSFPNCGTGAAQAASFQERPQRHHLRHRSVAGRQRRQHVAVLRRRRSRPDRHVRPFVRRPDDLSGAARCDARYKIAVPMAPAALFNPDVDRSVADDAGGDRRRREQRRKRARPTTGSSAPKMKVEIAHAGHFAFSDGCFPSADCNPPTTLTQDEAHATGAALGRALPAALPGRRHERRAAARLDAAGRVGGAGSLRSADYQKGPHMPQSMAVFSFISAASICSCAICC